MATNPAMIIRIAANLEELKKNLAEGKIQIETTTAAMAKLSASFSGDKLVQHAHNVTAAINQVGASTLSASEAARNLSVLERAMEKLELTGKPIPGGMRETAAALSEVVEKAKPATGFFADLTTQVKGIALGFITAQAVIGTVQGAFHALTGFVAGSVDSYAHAEAAAKKMTTALQAQGHATPEVIGHFNDLATQFQKTTVYSDDLINEMEALLVQIGNVAPSQMNKALTAATDLASGLGVDLQTATMLVGKAFAGHTESLGKYGIVLDAAKVKTEGLTYVLDQIQTRFGGQAQSEAETYAGKVKQIANAWDNVKEAVGKTIVDDPVLIAAMRQVKEAADGTAEGGNAITAAWNSIKVSAPDWLKALGGLHSDLSAVAEAENTVADAAARMNAIAAKSPLKQPAAFSFADIDAKAKQTVDDTIAGWKKEDEAAAQHAAALESLFKRLSGADAAAQMKDLDTVFRRMASSGQVTEAQVRQVATEAAGLAKQGALLTPRLWDIVLATGAISPPAVQTSLDIGKIGTQIEIVIPRIGDMWTELNKPIPYGITNLREVLSGFPFVATGVPKAEEFIVKVHDVDKALSALTQAFAQMAQIAGTSLGAVIQHLGTLVGSLETANKSVKAFSEGKKAFSAGDSLAGIAGMASGIMGIASAALAAGKAIKDMFFGTAGRDAVKEFAATFQQFDLSTMAFKPGGGFEELHAKLLSLSDPAYGERLWKALSQGVGRNNPEQAAAVIKMIQDALANTKTAIDATATAATAAGDAQVEATKKAQAAVDEMTGKIQSLQDSIKNEAPEEVMGIVEANTRAQMDALVKQRDAAQAAIDQTTATAADAAAKAGDVIDAALAAREYHIRVKVDLDGLPGGVPAIPMAGGGDFMVTRPTLFLAGEAGPERATFSGANRSGAGSAGPASGGGDIYLTTQTILDGKVLDERTERIARKAAQTGRLKTRATAGRGY